MSADASFGTSLVFSEQVDVWVLGSRRVPGLLLFVLAERK
jgi:hypothetical protein